MDRTTTSNGHNEPSKQSSFNSTYTTLCKDKNVPAILELIKNKYKLDFVADRIKADQWEMIYKSLDHDNTLELLAIRSRKSSQFVNEKIDPDKRCSTIAPLIRSVSECVKRNDVMTKLALEGLPMIVEHIQTISTAISQNTSLKTLSFARSNVMDEGCNVICYTIRDLPHIEKINLSQCFLTATAAIYISDLIKFQTMNRNSESWMKSLRYREVDVDSVPGLKCLILNGNQFRDEGLELITSILKEDLWMKAIEVQNCEITDVGGEGILDCLKFNKTLLVFNASHNYKISNQIHKKIQMILSTEPDNYDSLPKITNIELREKIEFLEQRLQLEIFNRDRADDLNVQLHKNLEICEVDKNEKSYLPPIGYKIIESGNLNELYKEIEDLLQEKSNTKKNSYHTDNNLKRSSGEQSGFGDTITPPDVKTFSNFEPMSQESTTRELNTSITFTPYSQESSICSKLDEDISTLNSDDEAGCSFKLDQTMLESFVPFDQFNQEIRGNEKYMEMAEYERNDLFNTVN